MKNETLGKMGLAFLLAFSVFGESQAQGLLIRVEKLEDETQGAPTSCPRRLTQTEIQAIKASARDPSTDAKAIEPQLASALESLRETRACAAMVSTERKVLWTEFQLERVRYEIDSKEQKEAFGRLTAARKSLLQANLVYEQKRFDESFTATDLARSNADRVLETVAAVGKRRGSQRPIERQIEVRRTALLTLQSLSRELRKRKFTIRESKEDSGELSACLYAEIPHGLFDEKWPTWKCFDFKVSPALRTTSLTYVSLSFEVESASPSGRRSKDSVDTSDTTLQDIVSFLQDLSGGQ